MEKKKKQDLRKRSVKQFIFGFCLFVPGLVLTLLSYNAASPGGHFYVFFGFIVFGIWNIVSGIYSFFRPGKDFGDISTSAIAIRLVYFIVFLFAAIMISMLIMRIFGVDFS